MKFKLLRTPKFLLVLLLMASFAAPLFATTKVFAAGEKYVYGDVDKKTIIGSGGVYKSPITLTKNKVGGLEAYRTSESSPAQTTDSGCSKRGIQLTTSNPATLTFFKPGDCTVDGIDRTNIPIGEFGAAEGGSGGSGTGEEDDKPSCEEQGGPLAWILCPVINATDNALNTLDESIQRLLEIDKDKYKTNADIKAAWGLIRNFAYLILLPIMLIMVIGTALGFEFFDAYTVKRALPRLAAATVFVSVSYYICVLLIDLSNGVGQATLGLMTSPFGEGVHSLSLRDLFGPSAIQTLIAVPAAVGVIILLWLFGSTLLLFVAIAFLVLLLRQMFIIALLLLSPLAILAWIFPGNDRLWKSWWGLFSKLLIMYPLIMGVIAVGRIFAWILRSDGGGSLEGSILTPLMTLAAYLLPYAFIPFTFKFAGGLFANVAGIANDRSKGFFDRAKQRRGDKMERAKSGNTFKGAAEGSMRSRLNRGIQRTSNYKKAGLRPTRWGANLDSAIQAQEFDQAMEASEKLPGARSFFASDDLMMAGLEGGGDHQKTYDYLTKKKEDGGAGWTADQAQLGAAQAIQLRRQMGGGEFTLAALAKLPGTGTAFEKENIGKWHELIAANTHGNKSVQASLIAVGKKGFRDAQRYEVSEAGFGDHLGAVGMAERGKSTKEITDMLVDKAYAGGGAGAVVGARNDKSAEMFARAMERDVTKKAAAHLANPNDQEAEAAYMRSLAQVAGIQDGMAGGKRIVTDVIAKQIMGTPVSVGGQESTMHQLLDDSRTNQYFLQARKDFQGEARLAGDRLTPEERAEQLRRGIDPQQPGSTGVGGGITPLGPR